MQAKWAPSLFLSTSCCWPLKALPALGCHQHCCVTRCLLAFPYCFSLCPSCVPKPCLLPGWLLLRRAPEPLRPRKATELSAGAGCGCSRGTAQLFRRLLPLLRLLVSPCCSLVLGGAQLRLCTQVAWFGQYFPWRRDGPCPIAVPGSRDSRGSRRLTAGVAPLEIPASSNVRISRGEFPQARTAGRVSRSEMSEVCCLLSVMDGSFSLLFT